MLNKRQEIPFRERGKAIYLRIHRMDIVTIFVTIVPVIFIVPHLIFANRLGDKTPDSHEGGDSIYVPMKVLTYL